MKVVEQTPTRLVLQVGIPVLSPTTCTLDKTTGLATVVRKVLLVPKKKEVPLTDIVGMTVERQESSAGEGTQVIYFPALQLRSGEKVSISGVGQAGAEQATRLIREFLGLPA